MLNHRNISIVYSVLFTLIISLDFVYSVHWIWYVAAAISFLSIEFYGAYFVNSGFHIKTICSIKTNEKIVALSFDDGPMQKRTENVLSVLKKFDVKATFFLIGNRLKGNEELVKTIVAQGHLIGNHSYSHSYFFDLMNTGKMINDLQTCTSEIKKITGTTPLFFRPPYGVTTPNLARACKHLKFEVVGWNVRSLDTTKKSKQQLVERVIKRIKPGSILLFHDTVDGVEIALEEILNYLKEKKLQSNFTG